MKKAMAYSSDVIQMRSGEVISRAAQKEAIKKYAAENGIEVVGWFEDEAYEENVLSRPGVQKMVAALNGCDTVLVERVWSFSRNVHALEKVYAELEKNGARVEAATELWDIASQKCRHRFSGKAPAAPAVSARPAAAKVHKPATVGFGAFEPVPAAA